MLYMIGSNRNLLGATFPIKAIVHDVNGLVAGNNVRYKGINVGTVKSISIENDTCIFINMVLNSKMRPFIKKNTVASIGTEGLLGNKLVNLYPQEGISEPIKDGDIIYTQVSVDTDHMLKTLNSTNNNVEKISQNLYQITEKLNNSRGFWTLLADTLITEDIQKAMEEFRKAGQNTAELTLVGRNLVLKYEKGNGIADLFFNDSLSSQQLAESLYQVKRISDQTALMVENLKNLSDNLVQGEGSAGLIMKDSLFRESLIKTIYNIEQGTQGFNQNMEALKGNFLFRRYYKKLEKEKKEKFPNGEN